MDTTPTELDYADNRWIEKLLDKHPLPESTPTSSCTPSTQVDTFSPQTYLSRYFTIRYFPDVCGEGTGDDLCILQHSNRICVLGLAPGHHLFHGCLSHSLQTEINDKKKPLGNHVILGVDFQLSDSFNLLKSKVSGRRKRGSHRLKQGNFNQCLGYAICDRGERHALLTGGGLPGRLYESNSRLSVEVAVKDRVPLAPIGYEGSNEAFLAIIMPFRAPANNDHGDGCDDLEAAQYVQSSTSFLTKDGFLTGGLTWGEYKELRNL